MFIPIGATVQSLKHLPKYIYMKMSWLILSVSLLLVACSKPREEDRAGGQLSSMDNGEVEILSIAEVEWEQLNPARGDQSPQAGTLWGNRRWGEVPTGFLAKFVDGFSSPPHIHNATYRAVVIEGLVHNDDPEAEPMWMPKGSFWTQPKGEVHITSAKGPSVIALVEIDQGPYLVMPPEERFDKGERPINMVLDNVVWVAAEGFTLSPENPQQAFLWGGLSQEEENGTFLKLPSGFTGTVTSAADLFRMVVIEGGLTHKAREEVLKPGSYVGSSGAYTHHVSSTVETLLYIRTKGRYSIQRNDP